jgi:hypothetical protein
MVPKQQRNCYLIDSLSLALRSQTTVLPDFRHLIDSNLTQVFCGAFLASRGNYIQKPAW